MSLQWYPGHMTKAKQELARLMPSQDFVIEVLDARLPHSSANPVVTALRRDKPCLKVLTKSDLADEQVTRRWLQHFSRMPGVTGFAASSKSPAQTRTRIATYAAALPGQRAPGRPIRALITGVPNVGKSTLLNTLANRPVAAVGNKPAVTKQQQSVKLESGILLTDSPGLMWPKIEDEAGALRLAFAGSIPDTALDYLTVGLFGVGLLLERYPDLLRARYGLAALPETPEQALRAIGEARGARVAGAGVDLHRAAELLVQDFRTGLLGRITLESPTPPEPPSSQA